MAIVSFWLMVTIIIPWQRVSMIRNLVRAIAGLRFVLRGVFHSFSSHRCGKAGCVNMLPAVGPRRLSSKATLPRAPAASQEPGAAGVAELVATGI